MGEFENAQAFEDGFFAALAARAPRTQRYAGCRIAAVGKLFVDPKVSQYVGRYCKI